MKVLNIDCPRCKKKFNYYSSDFRPFCSEQCRLIDLGQWLNESYSVPAQQLTPKESEELEQLIHEKDRPTYPEEDENLH
jgi:uncharacterized protein